MFILKISPFYCEINYEKMWSKS